MSSKNNKSMVILIYKNSFSNYETYCKKPLKEFSVLMVFLNFSNI